MSRTYRQPYSGSKKFDRTCRCHGSCCYCQQNRTQNDRRKREAAEEALKEYMETKDEETDVMMIENGLESLGAEESANEPDVVLVPSALTLEEMRYHTLIEAAGDICVICANRLSSAPPLTGPDDVGNYVHGGRVCPASPIWARIDFEFPIRCTNS